MLNATLSLLAILVFVMLVEYLWHSLKLKNERSRQLVHIGVGVFVAFWPYYMSYLSIGICSIVLFIAVMFGRHDRFVGLIKWPKFFPFNLAARELKFVENLNRIDRPSWGVLIFPVSIGFLALFEPAPYVFAIAMLNVGLADGLAALVGTKYGKTMRYKVFDQYKSLVGTLTFFAISLLIVLSVKTLDHSQTVSISWFTVIFLPLVLTMAENFAVYGTDDFMIPLLTLVILDWFHN
jgi:dolichol kinase